MQGKPGSLGVAARPSSVADAVCTGTDHGSDVAAGYPDVPALLRLSGNAHDAERLLALELSVLQEDLVALVAAITPRDAAAGILALHRILGGMCTFGDCPVLQRGRQLLQALRLDRHVPDQDLHGLLRELALLTQALEQAQRTLASACSRAAQAPA
jgi:hypothetical protein